jgi:WD40 repeat protein
MALTRAGPQDAPHWLTSSSAHPSRVVLWAINSAEAVAHCLPDHDAKYGMCMATRMHAAADSSCTVVAGTYESGHVLFWDLRSPHVPLIRALMHAPSEGSAVSGLCLDWQADTCHGVAGGTDPHLVSFTLDVPRGECHVTSRTATGVKGGTAVVRYDPSMTRVSTGGWDHRARVWPWPMTAATPVTLKHAASVTDIAWTRDWGLVVGTSDGHVTVWSVS